MVHREGVLEAVDGGVPGGPEPADVVDQHVQPWVRREHLVREPAHLVLGGHVGDEDVDRVRRMPREPLRGGLGPGGVPADDADPGAERGETGGGGQPDPTGAAGDQ